MYLFFTEIWIQYSSALNNKFGEKKTVYQNSWKLIIVSILPPPPPKKKKNFEQTTLLLAHNTVQ